MTRPALDAFLQVVPDLTPRIPWALVGATALEALGLERSTSDVDIFVADDRREVISVFRDAGFRLAHYSDQHVGAFPRRHTGAGDRVDIHFPRLNWLQRPIRDALETELHGVGVRVIEPVALAAMKLMGPRDLDVEDAAMLIGAGIVQVGDVIALLRRLEREGDPAAARDPWVRMLFQPGLALRRLRGRA